MKNLVIWLWTVRAVAFWPRRAACSVLVPRLGIEPRSGSEGKRRRKWQPTPVFLPGKFHGQRSLVGYSPWDRKESDTTEQLHSHSLVVKALSPNQWTAREFPFVFLVCVFQERKKKKKGTCIYSHVYHFRGFMDFLKSTCRNLQGILDIDTPSPMSARAAPMF